jgi:hypothetical protein
VVVCTEVRVVGTVLVALTVFTLVFVVSIGSSSVVVKRLVFNFVFVDVDINIEVVGRVVVIEETTVLNEVSVTVFDKVTVEGFTVLRKVLVVTETDVTSLTFVVGGYMTVSVTVFCLPGQRDLQGGSGI